MVVFDLPERIAGRPIRAACVGSCRVRNPIAVLGERGDLMVCATGLAECHTAAEAQQGLDLVAGRRDLSAALSPYVFGTEQMPQTDRLKRAVDGGVDVFLVEISDDRVFSCDGAYLQQNFVTRNLVQPRGRALLPWYRQLARAGAADDACVAEALKQIRQAPGEDDAIARLLHGTRLERHSAERTKAALTEMMAAAGGRWVVVGTFEVPEDVGAIMQDRRARNATLESVARQCGAAFYNPTDLILEHGRERVLDDEGANIFEYAPAFYPAVGEKLVDLALECADGASGGPSARELRRATESRSGFVVRLDDSLTSFHRQRLTELGANAGAVYSPSQQRRIESGSVVNRRARAAFELVEAYLPDYETYAVLRAGLGELPLILAASGRRTVACEPSRRRRDSLSAGAEHLERAGLLKPGALSIQPGPGMRRELGGRVLGIGISGSLATGEASVAAMAKNLSGFEALLVYPESFLAGQGGDSAKRKRGEALARAGFDLRQDYERERLVWLRRSAPLADQGVAGRAGGLFRWLAR